MTFWEFRGYVVGLNNVSGHMKLVLVEPSGVGLSFNSDLRKYDDTIHRSLSF